MELGAFSISLTVKDIATSRQFYEKLGFVAAAGNEEEDWLILKNGGALIGLFHDTQSGNLIIFNLGWFQDAHELSFFTDIRQLQDQLEENGVEIYTKVSPDNNSGPAHMVLLDPDGNSILIEQYR